MTEYDNYSHAVKREVTVQWIPEDIKSIRDNWSMDKCANVLESIRHDLEDGLVSHGWELIEILLDDLENRGELECL